MTRRTMITALASATLVPTARLFAGPTPPSAPHVNSDKKFAAMITALERGTWEAFQKNDAKAWASYFTDGFFEITADGWLTTKEGVLDLIHARTWETPHFKMSDIEVFRLTETSALIRYIIDADFLVDETPENATQQVITPYFTNATAVGTYINVRGRWLSCLYQETTLPEFQEGLDDDEPKDGDDE